MVQINFAQKQVNAKLVYYGPGMSGKTTNLEVVHQRAPEDNRGDLTSISTDGDRTLFFDYMPLALGTVAGMRTCFQLYTVPGQVYYNSTRKLVLQGVDGVIFIADSSRSMLEQNLESLRNLEENLNEYGKSLSTLPYVIQFNKRDLPDAMPIEELNEKLNRHNVPYFEGVASTGQGVFPTLKRVAAIVLQNIMSESSDAVSGPPVGTVPPAVAPPAPATPAATLAQTPPAMPQPAPQPAPQQPAASGARPAASRPRGGGAAAGAQHAASPPRPTNPMSAAAPAAGGRVARAPVNRPQGQAQAQGKARRAPAQKRQAARPAAAGRQAQAAQQHAAPAEPTKSGKLFTAAFVVLAIAVGALLASVILNVV